MPGAGGDDDGIVGQFGPAVIDHDDAAVDVYRRCLAENHRGVALPAQPPANWHGDVGRRHGSRGDLIQERLEQVVVRAIDQCLYRLARP